MDFKLWRFPLLALSIVLLMAALWAGLVRIGWDWPAWQPALVPSHGPLMVAGFLGTLIALERAVALRRPWAYLPPALTAAGGLFLAFGVLKEAAPLLITLGSLGLSAVFIVIVRQHPALYTRTMAVGVFAWAVGNLLWLFGRPIYEIVLWWAGFLVLTIAGERLELGRLARLPRWVERLFAAAAGVILLGLVLISVDQQTGTRVAGAGMLALAAWLLRFDIARRTLRKGGLPRFAAVALLAGYAWLAFSGLLGLIFGAVVAGPRYDALLHSVFIGFVISMIFGHAPIILPAVLGLPVTFRPLSYVPLSVLHISLAMRILGDFTNNFPLRRWGALLNALAILLYLAATVSASLFNFARQRLSASPAHPPASDLPDSPPTRIKN